MNKTGLFEKIKKMNFPLREYAIFGSGLLCVKELRECSDIDIIMSEKLFKKTKNNPGWELEIKDNGSECLKNNKDKTEAFKKWWPGKWDCGQLIRDAEIIDGVPFVQKEHIIKWKKIRNSEKDQKDLALLNNI